MCIWVEVKEEEESMKVEVKEEEETMKVEVIIIVDLGQSLLMRSIMYQRPKTWLP